MNREKSVFGDIENEIIAREKFIPLSLTELLSTDFPENKWVIEKLIPHQGITILSGAPASFKTWLLLRMAIDIATGGSLLGQFRCEKYRVLIIDEENHLRLIKDRLELLDADSNVPIYFLSQKGFLTSKQYLVDLVLKICTEKEIDVIFIDSLVRISNAKENDASDMAEVFRNIKQFCQNGKTVIVTHHERKEQAYKSSAQSRLRGSSDISASVDAHISIVRDKNDRSKFSIEQAKLRSDEEIDSFEATIKSSNGRMIFTYLGSHSNDASQKENAKNAIVLILENKKEGLSKSDICKTVSKNEAIGSKSTRNAINELIKEKVLLEKQGQGNTKICYLPNFNKTEIPAQQEVLI